MTAFLKALRKSPMLCSRLLAGVSLVSAMLAIKLAVLNLENLEATTSSDMLGIASAFADCKQSFVVDEEMPYCAGVTYHLEACVAKESLRVEEITAGSLQKDHWREFVQALKDDPLVNPMDGYGHLTFLIHHANPSALEHYPGQFHLGYGRAGFVARYRGPAEVVVTGPHSAEVTVPIYGSEGGCGVFSGPEYFYLDRTATSSQSVQVCVTSPDITFKGLPRLTRGRYKGVENVLCSDPARRGGAEWGKTAVGESVEARGKAFFFPLVKKRPEKVTSIADN